MALQSMGGDGVCRWWSAEMIPLMAYLLGVDLNQKATNRKRRHHQRNAVQPRLVEMVYFGGGGAQIITDPERFQIDFWPEL